MTFVPYGGTATDWEVERTSALLRHDQTNENLVHDNLLAELCVCQRVVAAVPQVASFDGRTCANCGGSSFYATGSCHTCATCATSDGCG